MDKSRRIARWRNLDSQCFPVLSQYFNKFLSAYAQNGVPVTRIAVQNEPLNNNTGYPTDFLTDAEDAQFIAGHLGPSIALRNFFSNEKVEILGYEDNRDVQWYPEWPDDHRLV